MVVRPASASKAPNLPASFGILATVLALVCAARFTSWYPNRISHKK